MKPLSKMAKFRCAVPERDAHAIVRAGGHKMACVCCGVIGEWSGKYGFLTRRNTSRVVAYVLCTACVDLAPEVYTSKVDELLALEERWERAS